jgi:hypothetical protein
MALLEIKTFFNLIRHKHLISLLIWCWLGLLRIELTLSIDNVFINIFNLIFSISSDLNKGMLCIRVMWCIMLWNLILLLWSWRCEYRLLSELHLSSCEAKKLPYLGPSFLLLTFLREGFPIIHIQFIRELSQRHGWLISHCVCY